MNTIWSVACSNKYDYNTICQKNNIIIIGQPYSYLLLFYSVVKSSNRFGTLHHAGPIYHGTVFLFFSGSSAMKLKYPRLIGIRNCTETYL